MTKAASIDLIKSAVRANFALASDGAGMFPTHQTWEDQDLIGNAVLMILMVEYGHTMEAFESEVNMTTEDLSRMKREMYEYPAERLQHKINLCRNYIRLQNPFALMGFDMPSAN